MLYRPAAAPRSPIVRQLAALMGLSYSDTGRAGRMASGDCAAGARPLPRAIQRFVPVAAIAGKLISNHMPFPATTAAIAKTHSTTMPTRHHMGNSRGSTIGTFSPMAGSAGWNFFWRHVVAYVVPYVAGGCGAGPGVDVCFGRLQHGALHARGGSGSERAPALQNRWNAPLRERRQSL